MSVGLLSGLELIYLLLSVLEVLPELGCLLLTFLEPVGHFLVVVGGDSQFFIGACQFEASFVEVLHHALVCLQFELVLVARVVLLEKVLVALFPLLAFSQHLLVFLFCCSFFLPEGKQPLLNRL